MDLDRFRRLAAGDRLRGQYQVSKQLFTDLEEIGDVPYTSIQLFQQRISHKIVKAYSSMTTGVTSRDSLASLD